MMTNKILLINCSSRVSSFIKEEFPLMELMSCSSLEEAKNLFKGPALVFRDLALIDFDVMGLFLAKDACALVELSFDDQGYGLEDGRLALLQKKEHSYVDSFKPIGAYRINSLSELVILESCVGVRALVGGRTGNQYSLKDYKKALYLDRDGILNHDGGYLYEFEKMSFYDEIIPLLKLFKDNNYFIFVITNQSGIARGRYLEEDVKLLHEKMTHYFKNLGALIDQFYYSAHHEEKGEGVYKAVSFTRKPWPGMVSLSMMNFPVTLADSVMIGDKKSDDLMSYPGLVCHMQRAYDLSGASAPIFQNYEQLKMFLATRFFKSQN